MIKIYHKNAREDAIREIDKPLKGSWICVARPDEDDIVRLSKMLDLDQSTLTDALDPYEAPRIAVDETDVYIFTRYCHPENKYASTEPMLILYTPAHVVTVSPYAVDFLNDMPKKIMPTTTQKTKFVLELLGQVNDTYRQYLDQITRRVFRIRTQLKQSSLSNQDFLSMVDIEEDLNEMLTSLQSYSLVLEALFAKKYIPLHELDKELMEDLKLGTSELIEITKSRLRTMENIRDVYSAISTNTLNATFKRLTSISIFLAIPTILGGLYGMNVRLPLEASQYAFWFVLASIAVLTGGAIAIFHRNKWL